MKLGIAALLVGSLSRLLSLTPPTVAQTSSAQTTSALPRLVRFGGTAKDLNGNPLTGVVGITFALYSEQTGGAGRPRSGVASAVAKWRWLSSPKPERSRERASRCCPIRPKATDGMSPKIRTDRR